jgi:hypothetical protein
MLGRGKTSWRGVRRRLISAVTLLVYVFSSIGYPLPESYAQSGGGTKVCCCGSEKVCRASGCGCAHSTLPPPEQMPAPGSCCSHGAHQADSMKTCCKQTSATGKSNSTPSPTPDKSKNTSARWVVGVAAQKCRGGASGTIHSPAAVPASLPITWLPVYPFCYSIPLGQEHPAVVTADLLDPPPRF